MRSFSKGMLEDVFGGFLVYRNLVPVDDRLPSVDDVRPRLGLGHGVLPRKAEPMYSRVVGEILQTARSVLGIRAVLRHLLYIGDTLHSDVAAFSHLCRTMGWGGRAFIADEHSERPTETRWLGKEGQLVSSAAWDDVRAFAQESTDAGFGCDASTVIVVDIDKTLLGARGRNDHMIDEARRRAAYEMVCEAAGDDLYGESKFTPVYDRLNHSSFHLLTDDNQDAVAYAALLVACNLYRLDELATGVAQGRIRGIQWLIEDAEGKKPHLPRRAAEIHDSIRDRVTAGHPTPYLAFRRAEYRWTKQLMGCLPDDAPRESLVEAEITITKEVWEAAHEWKSRGCIVFGLSDKPDEACFPTSANENPIHAIRTHILGGR